MTTYAPEHVVVCPHCNTTAHFSYAGSDVIRDTDQADHDEMEIMVVRCEQCHRLVTTIEIGQFEGNELSVSEAYIWPSPAPRTAPTQVPHNIAKDFREAAAILEACPRAGAALARQCLQAVMIDNGFDYQESVDIHQQKAGVDPSLPKHLVEGLNAIRWREPGSIVDVEPGEGEWIIEMLAALFEHFYVAPDALRRLRSDLLPSESSTRVDVV